MALHIAHNAVNDMMGSFGLVPSLLVHGMLPRLPVVSSEFPDQHSIMRALEVAQNEYASLVAGLRISLGLMLTDSSGIQI